MIVSPSFWEWFNIWLAQFLKDLYHEIKMVALRGTNNSLGNLSHCLGHGSGPGAEGVGLSMPAPMGLPPLSNVSVQFIPQPNNTPLKHEHSSRYSNSNCMLPSHHYRLLTQARPECYLPAGATGPAYMQSAGGGAQPTAQAALRVPPTPQPSAPPAPQQDMSKTTMAGHNYVSAPNTPQARPQFNNFPYRTAQHGSRPNTLPRQQQPYNILNTAPTATGHVGYIPTYAVPAHMIPPYQQQRSSTPGAYYPWHPPFMYGTPPNQYYYQSNSQQLPAANLAGSGGGARSNPTSLVGPQAPAAPPAPATSLPQPQPAQHMHQPIPGIRPTQQKRPSQRIPIINPETQQEVLPELYNNDYVSGESSERQTPQPESSIVEEFNRRITEAANQPTVCESNLKTNYVSKNVDSVPISSPATTTPTQSNTITSNNNNVVKTDILTVNESKPLGPDIAVESNETPVVSAISDSPVIVPKMPINVKQLQKNSDQNMQSVVVDKNVPSSKPQKQKSKPVVPQDDIEPEEISELPPQPQRVPRERREDKDKDRNKDGEVEKEASPAPAPKPNGPTPVVISSVDSLTEAINQQTSQVSSAESTKKPSLKESSPLQETVCTVSEPSTETDKLDSEPPVVQLPVVQLPVVQLPVVQPPVVPVPVPTATLLSSIEKLARELPTVHEVTEGKEESSAIQAQAKLTQSLASCQRTNQTDSKMKDINLNNKTTDTDTANGNTTELVTSETAKEDVNKNEKGVKNTKNSKKSKMANNDVNAKEAESLENGKTETDKINSVEQEGVKEDEAALKPDDASEKAEAAKAAPKYHYRPEQWSPWNTTGKKCYDIGLLKQMKDDPKSKNKPEAPLLETMNVIRTVPMQDSLSFAAIPRPGTDVFLPTFAKPSGMPVRSTSARDPKKDGRGMVAMSGGKGSAKLPSSANSNSSHKPMIHVSLSRGEEIKLNESKDPWKPLRLKKDNLNEDEFKTEELYKKFRGILNKLTPQKFDTLLDKVRTLEINNHKRLEGVIDLVFEKAIEEPNFSVAYANMCHKLSVLKVPAENASNPDQFVNFRALIINKCQSQFEKNKADEQVIKLEKELNECTDATKKKELQLQLNEENRRIRMRSVGNVRFIGELYKLKMLTSKIMVYCMNYLMDKQEEEKLECLCKLLTTIGEQVESEVKEPLDMVFKKLQEIVDRRNNNRISSRVRFMIQDVIELRHRKWVGKGVVDLQPKMMDQIQKEAEQHQRHIELMNAAPMGYGRGGRDDGGRGKRGDARRQNSYMEPNNWKTSARNNYTVEISKLKAATGPKNIATTKLAPNMSIWNQGSGAKTTSQTASNSMSSLTKTNKYSLLDTQTDPTPLRPSKDTNMSPNYHSKGASIERSTFDSRADFTSGGGNRSGSMSVGRSNSSSRSPAPPTPPAPAPPAAREPLPDAKKKSVKAMVDLCVLNPVEDLEDLVEEVKQLYPPQYHADFVTEILNNIIEKSMKEIDMFSKILLHLVTTNTISADNFLLGLKDMLEIAPDLHIDIPMLYEYIAKILVPQIEKKHITLVQIFRISDPIISANQGSLFLKSLIANLKDSMGPSFAKSKWQESGLQLKQWLSEDQVPKWIEDNKFEMLEGGAPASEDTKNILSPAETQSMLLQLMNSDENCECIRGWVLDKVGDLSNAEWFMRALIQAICEHALFGADGRDVPHFNQERMNKYSRLIAEFGDSQQAREASCLFGIQQLIHRLEHPQGLTLEIFQYLHEQYIISTDAFIAWESSEMEPEGKGVMIKALTSFFTNIKEADNEDSCSED